MLFAIYNAFMHDVKMLRTRKVKTLMHFIVIVLIAVVFVVIHLLSVSPILENYQIEPKVFVFFNVCIEPLPEPVVWNKYEITFNVTQRIVSYDSLLNKHHGDSLVLEVNGPTGHPWNEFDVEVASEALDPSRLRKETAFFISSRCPGNFHHFIKEDFLPLFSIMRSTGDLQPGADSWILYNTPNTNYNQFCRDYGRYDEILRTLYTNRFHDVYYNVPQNVCFARAVFGSVDTLARPRDAIDQIINGYNLSETCSAKRGKFVTIVLRKDRRILNIEELYRTAKKSSAFQVRLIEFSGKSIRQQMEIACKSAILIGVNGAALEWGIFMPEGSYVLEIWWRNWRPFYTDELKRFGIVHQTLEARVVRTNWTTYEIRMRVDVSLNSTYRTERAQRFDKDRENVAKWSDVFVNATEFQESLRNISKLLTALKEIN